MTLPNNLFMWVLAFLPIIALIVLMIGLKWGATKAAPVGFIITVITSMFFYKANLKLIAVESIKGAWSTLSILLIILTAILMYQVGQEANAFSAIKIGMKRLLPNELLLVLAMGWIFESFLQGITGFGVPVAVGAPLLIGIGVSPIWAVIIPLLGQSWGNTFGTLAVAWDALAISAGLDKSSAVYNHTAVWSAGFLFFWVAVTGLAITWFYGKSRALKKGLPAIIILTLIQGGGELLLSNINTTLSCFIPSCVSLLVILLLGKTSLYKDNWKIEDSKIMNRDFETKADIKVDMTLSQAFIPYFILSAITLIVLLVKPLYNFLNKISFGLALPETSTGYGVVNSATVKYSPISFFTHASMFLLISALVGLLYYQNKGWIKKGGSLNIFKRSVSMTMPSAIAVVTLVIMSKIMSSTGQTIVLANGIASTLGAGYTILSPFVGLLGTFMTGSNMSSNILFGDFQMQTANLLKIQSAAILAAQTVGGAIGSAVSPSKIILGTTTAQILGQEGEVLKKLLSITVPVTIIIGIFLYIFVV